MQNETSYGGLSHALKDSILLRSLLNALSESRYLVAIQAVRRMSMSRFPSTMFQEKEKSGV